MIKRRAWFGLRSNKQRQDHHSDAAAEASSDLPAALENQAQRLVEKIQVDGKARNKDLDAHLPFNDSKRKKLFQKSLKHLAQKYVAENKKEKVIQETIAQNQAVLQQQDTWDETAFTMNTRQRKLAMQHFEQQRSDFTSATGNTSTTMTENSTVDPTDNEAVEDDYAWFSWMKALLSCHAPNVACDGPQDIPYHAAEPHAQPQKSTLGTRNESRNNSSILYDQIVFNEPQQVPTRSLENIAPGVEDANKRPIPKEIVHHKTSSLPEKLASELLYHSDDSTISTRLSYYMQGGFVSAITATSHNASDDEGDSP